MRSMKSVAVFAVDLAVVGFVCYQATTASSGSADGASLGKKADGCCPFKAAGERVVLVADTEARPDSQCGDKKKDCEKKCGDKKKDCEKKCGDDKKKGCDKKVA